MIMAAIAVAAREARAAGFSISQSVASASTMDTLSGQVANALAIQNDINSHIHKGISQLLLQLVLVQDHCKGYNLTNSEKMLNAAIHKSWSARFTNWLMRLF